MAKRPALGKGLGALLPDFDDRAEEESEAGSVRGGERRGEPIDEPRFRVGRVTEIAVDRIDRNPYQPRTDFGEEALDELADSIRELGIVQPITVRSSENGRFELISGERRLRAARIAGLRRIPAYVREADMELMLEMALVENVQRKDLNPMEVAIGYEMLIGECHLTHEELARKVGKRRSTITNTLRLLKLPARIQASLRSGTISEGHARVLAGLEDEALQLRMLEKIERDDLPVRAVEKLARLWTNKRNASTDQPEKREPSVSDPNVQAVTDQLRRVYGTRVLVHSRSDGTGHIELDFFSAEELERLLELLLRS